MSVLTEIKVWRAWLNNYQAYQGHMTVPKAYELARVLGHAESEILSLMTERDIAQEQVRRAKDVSKDSL